MAALDDWLHGSEPSLAGCPALIARSPAGWTTTTYGDFDRGSRRVAVRLAAQGVGAGDRVAIMGDPGADWVVALFGVWRRGAVAVPVDRGLGADDLAAVLGRARPHAVIADAACRERVTRVSLGFDELAALPDGPDPDHGRDPDEAAMIVWTSGTDGAPKGVTLSLAGIAYVVDQGIAAHDLRPDDRWLSVLPPNHMLELSCGLLPALATGAAVTFAGTADPGQLVDVMRERRCTRMTVVPRLLVGLLRAMEGRPGHRPTLHCGGAPLDLAVADRLERLGVTVYTGYGLTETAPTVAMNTPGANRRGSVGRPLPGTEVRLSAGPERPTERGGGPERPSERGGGPERPSERGDGEILVRSPGVMLGYCGDEALTRSVVDEAGWLRTGDLGHLDADGFLYVTGRAKSMLVLSNGKKVQPEEVEQVLATSGLLAESCVVGWADQVCAVVVPSPELRARHPREEALMRAAQAEVAHLTARIAPYKRPRLVRVVAALPRTPKRSVRRAEVLRLLR